MVAMSRLTFTVTAERGSRRWVLQCREHPGALSEVARLTDAEDAIREAIAFVADRPADSFDVDVIPAIAAETRAHLDAARALREQASDAQRQASAEMRVAARQLRADGMPLRDIGAVLGISHQRAHQLVTEGDAGITQTALRR